MKMLNKIIGSSIAVAAVLAFSASTSQAQNLLVNPGFENAGQFTANPVTLAGVDQGWALNLGAANSSFQSDMSSSSDSPHSGVYSLYSVNNPGNNWNPAGAYQIVSGGVTPITPGWTYTLSAWFLTDTGVAHYGTPVALQLGFGNFTNPTNAQKFVDLGTVEKGAGNNVTWGFGDNGSTHGALPANDTWYQGSVSATAPAGATDAIVYLFFMDNGQTIPEHVYFDDASLIAVPEPSSLALLGMGLAAIPLFFIRRQKS